WRRQAVLVHPFELEIRPMARTLMTQRGLDLTALLRDLSRSRAAGPVARARVANAVAGAQRFASLADAMHRPLPPPPAFVSTEAALRQAATEEALRVNRLLRQLRALQSRPVQEAKV